MIPADHIVKRAIDVRARKVSDRHLVARGDDVRELNEVAAIVWKLADGTRSVAQISQRITEEYEVSGDEALADVTELVADLADGGFVSVRAPQ